LNRNILFTDGVKYVADAGGAYWLLDRIVSEQMSASAVGRADFQSWTLKVRANRTAILSCANAEGEIILMAEVTYTDFPLAEITLNLKNGVIYLPNED
jgi:hypothetical protein